MAKVRLEHRHIVLGQPLQFDLVDDRGRVWLKFGYVIQSQGQLDRLIDRGVFFEEIIDETQRQQQAKEYVSVFLRVSELAGDFERLFATEPVNYGAVLNITELIQDLCELDGDAALANIQLHKSGRYSLRHSFHSAVMTEMLLRHLDRPREVRSYAVAGALTMNIGMLELQDLLYQQDVPLTLEQKRAIVAHPEMAVEALRKQGIDHSVWLEVVGHHHEMIDGSGYPRRRSGDELSIESQAVSLADRFCALVSERKYRSGVLPSLAAQNLMSRQASTIAPALATAFTQEVGSYPPGTMVVLANGEVAVVVRRLLNLKQPMVRSLRSPSGIRYVAPPKRIASGPVFAIKEAVDAQVIKDFDWAILWSSVQLDEASAE
ncbi:metal dependent phosphohydrolase [Sideroxydans lithotrophicus ES-1]|uniref:Metal dependent phosphohydrolase n=1 Tax=Sideroxydans lithotrophicus (strain ES-1) TaxID=580332 RepID=D5CR83_SIDLE|nr:metal dependent phosphohydrolase [Sideroxydans lithotrophicus ES-1]